MAIKGNKIHKLVTCQRKNTRRLYKTRTPTGRIHSCALHLVSILAHGTA